jgi:hypothetical protein
VVVLLLVAGCAAAPQATPVASPAAGASPESRPASAAASGSPAPERTPQAASPAATAEPPPEAAAWTELTPGGEAPTAREDHTWTVGGDGATAYLFGGRDGAGTAYADLWAYDLASDAWTPLAPGGPAPAARFGHEAAWADGIGLVVFAGQAGTAFFNDLWAYDPAANAWSELAAGGSVPVPRYGSCAAIGPDGRLWISHGFTSDGVRFSDTRAYDFAVQAWTDVTPGGGRPVERCLHGCWVTPDGSFVLYGGQTTGIDALGDLWSLAGGAWSRFEGSLPADRNLYAHAGWDEREVVFGGGGRDGAFLDDTWQFDGGAAAPEQIEIGGAAPPGRAAAELIADPDRDRLLLFGGKDASGARADVWQLSLP